MKKNDWFEKLLADIKELKIQGAEPVARAAIEGLARLAKEQKTVKLAKEAKLLAETRPTEPMMRNAIAYFLEYAEKEGAEKTAERLLRGFDESAEKIAEYAAALMVDGGCYHTHCHSGTVMRAFRKAQEQGKKITVHNTETRPLYQGRITAKEIAKEKIPVKHFVDSATRLALKGCDAVFIGADALLSDGKVANKIGSEMLAEMADNKELPLYILANSWKYDPKTDEGFKETLETRNPDEVWKGAPEGVMVENPAFELINPRYITAIITEHGIRDPHTTVRELRERQTWFFPTEKKA